MPQRGLLHKLSCGNRSRIRRSIPALRLHWEAFVGQAASTYAVFRKLIQPFDPSYKVFEHGDGSIEQRFWHINNCMKHVESRISSGQFLPESVSPVWMSDEGLRTTEELLTWEETAGALRDIGHWADARTRAADASRLALRERRAVGSDPLVPNCGQRGCAEHRAEVTRHERVGCGMPRVIGVAVLRSCTTFRRSGRSVRHAKGSPMNNVRFGIHDL